jgi:hypothetical protein
VGLPACPLICGSLYPNDAQGDAVRVRPFGLRGLTPVAVLMALDENDAASKAFLSALTQGLSP